MSEPPSRKKEKEWSDQMQDRRNSVSTSELREELDEIKRELAALGVRIPESPPVESLKRTPIKFETPEGRAAYESALRDASKAKSELYASRTQYRQLYDVTAAAYSAEGDVWADLQMMHANFVLRRSRWASLEAKLERGKRLAQIKTLLPWVFATIVGGLTVYGILQPDNFRLLVSGWESDLRLQLITLGAVVIITVAYAISWWRSRKKPKVE